MSDITNLTDKITQDAQKKRDQYLKKAQKDIEKMNNIKKIKLKDKQKKT